MAAKVWGLPLKLTKILSGGKTKLSSTIFGGIHRYIKEN
jgi:hypothetical protein